VVCTGPAIGAPKDSVVISGTDGASGGGGGGSGGAVTLELELALEGAGAAGPEGTEGNT
jgi:hypothetical protein